MRTKLTPEGVSGTREGRPERLRARLRGDLDKIVLKALRKDARQRYLSAEQLSEDICRHLAGEAVVAQKTTLVYRAGKFVRRHKLGLAAALLFVLTLIGGMLGAAWQARVARGHARKNRWLLYVAQTNLAAQAWQSANLEQVHELSESNRPDPGEEDLRGFEWYYLARLYHSRRDNSARRHAGEVWSVTFSPDGRKLASGSEDRTAKVWEAATHPLTRRCLPPGRYSAAFTPRPHAPVHSVVKRLALISRRLFGYGCRHERANYQRVARRDGRHSGVCHDRSACPNALGLPQSGRVYRRFFRGLPDRHESAGDSFS